MITQNQEEESRRDEALPSHRVFRQSVTAIEGAGHRPAHLPTDQLQRLVPSRERQELVDHPRGSERPAPTQGCQQPGNPLPCRVIDLRADVGTGGDSLASHLVQRPHGIEHDGVSFVPRKGAVGLPEQATRWAISARIAPRPP